MIAQSRVVHAKHGYYIFSKSFLIASCKRANVDIVIFSLRSIIHGRGVGLLVTSTVEVNLTEQDGYFATVF